MFVAVVKRRGLLSSEKIIFWISWINSLCNNECNVIRNTRLVHCLSLLVITFPLVQCQIIKMTTADNFQIILMVKMIEDNTWLSQQSVEYILYFISPWKPINKNFAHFVKVHQVLKSLYFYYFLQRYNKVIQRYMGQIWSHTYIVLSIDTIYKKDNIS